ncbi:MAG: Sapep family Mn(2+)-dependent dipeptidase [Oscillospiraceae bacterium]|jgi:succinyl-diaminopimelate desuccinylase|nr:Sapep family Mn(2+)-dependent dipeptidase [Oscillospiraceae bacterium]
MRATSDSRKDEIRQAIERWFDERSDALIGDLSRLIAVKSVNDAPSDGAPYGVNSRQALEVSRDILRNLGFETALFRDCMAIADLDVPTDAVPQVGLLVHSDVVAATGGGWTGEPYVAEIRNGNIYGRGATDNKGPAVASFYALAAARDVARSLGIALNGGARVIVGSAEEIGCVDIARYLKENAPPRYTFAPDANYPIVNVEKGRYVLSFGRKFEITPEQLRGGVFVRAFDGGETSNIIPRLSTATVAGVTESDIAALTREFTERTGVTFELTPLDRGVKITAHGVASHASRPQDGNNAQTALVSLLAALPLIDCDSTRAVRSLAKLFPHGVTDGSSVGIAGADDVSGALTLAFTVLKLTEHDFTATFDSRTPKISDSQDILGIAIAALAGEDIAVTYSNLTRCHVADKDSPFVRTLLGIYEEYTGLRGECLALGGTTYVHDIEGGVAFGCEMPGVDHRIHSADEFIPLETLLTSGKMFADAIIQLCDSAE